MALPAFPHKKTREKFGLVHFSSLFNFMKYRVKQHDIENNGPV